MQEKTTKICLIAFNIFLLIAGVAMFAGGLVLELNETAQNVLTTFNEAYTESQLSALAVTLIAVGALVILVTFLGCCGSLSESRCMLTLYFVFVLILFLCQLGIVVVGFVFGSQAYMSVITKTLKFYIDRYGSGSAEDTAVDTVQQFFGCCGYNGTENYENYIPSTPSTSNATIMNTTTAATEFMTTTNANTEVTTVGNSTMQMETTASYLSGNWPDSCCKTKSTGGDYVDKDMCHDTSLPLSILQNYVNTEGCASKIEKWVQDNFFLIAAIAIAIAVLEIAAMACACSIRKSLD